MILMKKSKKSKPKAPPQQIEPTIDWEVRPGGMLVQKRLFGSDPGCDDTAPIINIKVSHDSFHHHISLPSTSSFGDLKEVLARETNLETKDQRLLFRGKEKGDEERLDMAGVKDMSKVILLEDPASKERKLVNKSNDRVYLQAYDAVMKVRSEVDKLSHKVVAMETSFKKGVKNLEKEVEVLTELLMKELLKLDGIEAEGEAKAQRRVEVRRVQGYVDILDNLKMLARASHMNERVVPAVSVTTKWQTFDSGVGSLNAPNDIRMSTKITSDWEQFE
ncbi:BAG family molecular chaperone regulator 4 [Rutidosis leptorrhynchoides]|uniref:BAG family molecular chaperone regulator 4 n=1 Tax=Rutidosis leptorrhynchoides TaxID=125765 RepID=UPI003A997DC5